MKNLFLLGSRLFCMCLCCRCSMIIMLMFFRFLLVLVNMCMLYCFFRLIGNRVCGVIMWMFG